MASQWDVIPGGYVNHLRSTEDWGNLDEVSPTPQQKIERLEAQQHRNPRLSKKEKDKQRKEQKEKQDSNNNLKKMVEEGLSKTPITRMSTRVSSFLTAKGIKTKRRKKRKSNKKRNIKRKHSKRR